MSIDHVNLGLSRVISQYQGKDDFTDFLTAILLECEDIQQAGDAILASVDIDIAVGSQLDLIGRIVGIDRYLPNALTAPYFGFISTPNGLPYGELHENLVVWPRNFDTYNWTPTPPDGAIVYSHRVISPDGRMTADIIFDNTTTERKNVSQNVLVPNNDELHTFSLYILKTTGATSFPGIQLRYFGGTSNPTGSVTINTNTGILLDRTGFAPYAKSISSVGNYWRVSVSHPNNSTGNNSVSAYVYPAVNADASGNWVVTAIGQITIWHAQVETGGVATTVLPDLTTFISRASSKWEFNVSGVLVQYGVDVAVTAYDPETLISRDLSLEAAASNVLKFSAQFENVTWTRFQSSIVANSTTAPDGGTTADTLVENNTSNMHSVEQVYTASVAGQTYTFSVFVKAKERSKMALIFKAGVAMSVDRGAYFDLLTGVVSNLSAGVTAILTRINSGWNRISITTSTTAAGAASVFFCPVLAAGSIAYQGDGVSGVYVWGAQLELGQTASSYIPTVGALATRAADISTSPASACPLRDIGGAFYDDTKPAKTTLAASDPLFRQLIRAIVIRNRSTGTTEDFISVLQAVFPDDTILVKDEPGKLQVNIGIDRATTGTETAILGYSRIMPKPAGVAILQMPYSTFVHYFGFNPTNAPYGDEITGGGGPFAEDTY